MTSLKRISKTKTEEIERLKEEKTGFLKQITKMKKDLNQKMTSSSDFELKYSHLEKRYQKLVERNANNEIVVANFNQKDDELIEKLTHAESCSNTFFKEIQRLTETNCKLTIDLEMKTSHLRQLIETVHMQSCDCASQKLDLLSRMTLLDGKIADNEAMIEIFKSEKTHLESQISDLGEELSKSKSINPVPKDRNQSLSIEKLPFLSMVTCSLSSIETQTVEVVEASDLKESIIEKSSNNSIKRRQTGVKEKKKV
ncbi:hypothetical protein GEMRC1_012709 [Eukaryota sp. GEM-RC1]